MSLESRIRALQRSTLFSTVSETDLIALAETMREERFAKGEIVCTEGEQADRVFIVMSGGLEVRVAENSGRTVHLQHGDLFGEYGLFDESLRTATVASLHESVLLTLDYDRFRAFLLVFPEAMLAILSGTIKQLLTSQRRSRQIR